MGLRAIISLSNGFLMDSNYRCCGTRAEDYTAYLQFKLFQTGGNRSAYENFASPYLPEKEVYTYRYTSLPINIY